MSCGGVGGKAIKTPRVPEVYEIGLGKKIAQPFFRGKAARPVSVRGSLTSGAHSDELRSILFDALVVSSPFASLLFIL